MRADRPLAARLFVWMQHVLPQHALSRVLLWLTRQRLGVVTQWLIRGFVARFCVDLSLAAEPSVRAYASFNAFFTRALAPGVRPLPADERQLVSPVDGVVSAVGRLEHDQLLQCKGQWFSVQTLLGGDARLAALFYDGLFATLYLSPRDYHRIHMPLAGRLTTMVHVPGRLFSVNPTTVVGVPGLFARNERVVALFETAIGPLALVLVGAIFVGSIETRWAGVVTPPRARAPQRIDYPADTDALFARGEEMGRFNMGSTVIVLLPSGAALWSPEIITGTAVQCRAGIGEILKPA